MRLDRLCGVARAAGFETTCRAQPRRQPAMPKVQRAHEPGNSPRTTRSHQPKSELLSFSSLAMARDCARRTPPSCHGVVLCVLARASVRSSAEIKAPLSVIWEHLRRAITTRSQASGKESRRRRNHSRTARLIRFRSTALPTRRLALIPIRLGSPGVTGSIRNTNSPDATRRPLRETRSNSLESRRRSARPRRPVRPSTTISTPRWWPGACAPWHAGALELRDRSESSYARGNHASEAV